jgi:hypothetical protein
LGQPLQPEDFPAVDALQGPSLAPGAVGLHFHEHKDALGILHDQIDFAAAVAVVAVEQAESLGCQQAQGVVLAAATGAAVVLGGLIHTGGP